ncbi:uncharacterized protein J4E79_010950 [Alternaria viburni]|uniref:uncharacterized protein n=1 Tax=Alternaria viburni TaxID=566460 RepID=UPI0020C57D1E|nr:uncharacterized protein J4E79_010950 [Alternaria viburni]KAI4644815.1 hypothetical protein J4E79_010950 [Alternaria viburni]
MALDPATLRRYTGWYKNDKTSAERVAIALDGATMKLLRFDTITGAIKTSSTLSLDASTMRIGGDADIRALWRIDRECVSMSFAMRGEEVGSFSIKGASYSRYEPDRKSALLDLPAELRQAVWRYVLAGPGSLVISSPKDGKVVIQDVAGERTPYNRIAEIHKAFGNEAKFLELSLKHLLAKPREGLYLVNVLELSDSCLDRKLRKVTYQTNWGPDLLPRREVLHGLLMYAKKNAHVKMNIELNNWYLKKAGAYIIREKFVRFGIGLRRAIRGINVGTFEESAWIVYKWRGNKTVEELNAPNVSFWPAQEELTDKEWNKVKTAIGVKSFKGIMSGCGVRGPQDLDVIVELLKSYYLKGT